MEHLKVFLVKFIITGVLTFSVFGIYFHATIGKLFLMTLVVSGITYIPDLFILPKINQAIAAVADFAVLFLLFLGLGNLVVESDVPLFLPAMTAAYFGVLAEVFYHIYVMDRLHEPDNVTPGPIPARFQTEFSEEKIVGKPTEEQEPDEDS